MLRRKLSKRNRPSPKAASLARRRFRPYLEALEDRTMPTTTQWMAAFGGLTPANDFIAQAQEGKTLLHSAGIAEQNVQVLSAVDLSGSFIVQTPADVTLATLTNELQGVPGFIFAQDLTIDTAHAEIPDPDAPNGRVGWSRSELRAWRAERMAARKPSPA